MDEFRSSSVGDGRMAKMEVYQYGSNHDMRSYSVSYASSHGGNHGPREMKAKKGKRRGESSSSSKGGSGWSLSDPELQRKKRVAGYKVYSVEGKVKGSFRKSFRWIKERYTQVVYGW